MIVTHDHLKVLVQVIKNRQDPEDTLKFNVDVTKKDVQYLESWVGGVSQNRADYYDTCAFKELSKGFTVEEAIGKCSPLEDVDDADAPQHDEF
jgi:hypothetical protein